MGLFESKEEKAARKEREAAMQAQKNAQLEQAEKEICEKLMHGEVLGNLKYSIFEKGNPELDWILHCQDYYESRVRKVTLDVDSFLIQWIEQGEEEYMSEGIIKRRTVDVVKKEIDYAYTRSGYLPLHGIGHFNSGEVLQIWTSIVHDMFKTKLPDCEFQSIRKYEHSFIYKVPEMQLKDWF